MAENRKRLAFRIYILRIGAEAESGAYTQALTKHTAKSLIILTETVLYPPTIYGFWKNKCVSRKSGHITAAQIPEWSQ